MDGEDSSADLVSRSVAAGNFRRKFTAVINGNARCTEHGECDSIVMDGGSVTALPALTANSVEASRIRETAIGKIAGEQITKLMTLGLTEEEAEQRITNGFLSLCPLPDFTAGNEQTSHDKVPYQMPGRP